MHPFREHGGIVDHDVPFAALERVELTVAIADELFHPVGQFTGVRLAAVENGHLVPTGEGILYLKRAGESGPAENQNLEWRGSFFRGPGRVFLGDNGGGDEREGDAKVGVDGPADQLS